MLEVSGASDSLEHHPGLHHRFLSLPGLRGPPQSKLQHQPGSLQGPPLLQDRPGSLQGPPILQYPLM